MHKTKRSAVALLIAAVLILALTLTACIQPVPPAEAAKNLIDLIFDSETEAAYTVTVAMTWTNPESNDSGTTAVTRKRDCTVLVKGDEIHGKYVMDNGTPEYQGLLTAGEKYYTYEYTGEDSANAHFDEVEEASVQSIASQLCPANLILTFLKQHFPDSFKEKDGVFVLKEENYIDYYRFASNDPDATEIPEEDAEDFKTIAENFSLEVVEASLVIRQNVENGSYAYTVSDVGTTDFKFFHPLTLPTEPETPSLDDAATMAYLAGSSANYTYAANALISSNGEGQEYRRILGDQYHSKNVMQEEVYYSGRFQKDDVTYEYYGEENNISLQNIWGTPAGEDSLQSMFLQPIFENFNLFELAEDGIYRLPEKNYLAMYNKIFRSHSDPVDTIPEEELSMLKSYQISFSENSISISFRMDIYFADFTVTDIRTTVFEPYIELPEPTYIPQPSETVRSFAE